MLIKMKKMSIKWKFVWLCTVVLLVQFIFANIYLYNHSAELVRKQGEALVNKYLSQTKGSIESSLDNVATSANLVVMNENFQEYLRKYTVRYFQYNNASIDFQFDCVHMFRSIIAQTSNIREIEIHLEDHIFTLSSSLYLNRPNENKEAFNKVTLSPRENIGWMTATDADGNRVIFYRAPLTAISKSSGLRGWVDIIVRKDMIFQSVTELPQLDGLVKLQVIEASDSILYSTPTSEADLSKFADIHSYLPQVNEVRVDHVSGEWEMSGALAVAKTDWLLLCTIPKESFRLDIYKYFSTSLYILFVPIVLLAVVILLMTDYLLRPLKQLVSIMAKINHPNNTPPLMNTSLDEFGLLTNRFSKMMQRIDQQIETIRETEQLKREAEMSAFQSQIRQHFLYNTLALISWTARKEKASGTEKIANLFARYYRLALGKGETYIPLEREVELVSHYLDIQQYRFVDQLEYDMKICAPIGDYKVMRNILQPIVENAVEHGVLSKDQGKVLVMIDETEVYLVLRVIDDGAGAPPEIVKSINDNLLFDGENGFSLYSMKKTLQAYYGKDVIFDFQSVVNSGTVVTIKLLKERIRIF